MISIQIHDEFIMMLNKFKEKHYFYEAYESSINNTEKIFMIILGTISIFGMFFSTMPILTSAFPTFPNITNIASVFTLFTIVIVFSQRVFLPKKMYKKAIHLKLFNKQAFELINEIEATGREIASTNQNIKDSQIEKKTKEYYFRFESLETIYIYDLKLKDDSCRTRRATKIAKNKFNKNS